jgi:hypothetical protein
MNKAQVKKTKDTNARLDKNSRKVSKSDDEEAKQLTFVVEKMPQPKTIMVDYKSAH